MVGRLLVWWVWCLLPVGVVGLRGYEGLWATRYVSERLHGQRRSSFSAGGGEGRIFDKGELDQGARGGGWADDDGVLASCRFFGLLSAF